MSECRRTIDSLAAYADDLVQPEERRSIERHLSACPPCRRLADDERSGRHVLRHASSRLLNEPLPPGLRSRCEVLTRTGHGSRAALGDLRPWWRVRLVPV